MTQPILDVADLTVEASGMAGSATLVDRISFSVHGGEIVGLVGESGCGKSLTALALAGLLEYPIRVSADVLRLRGTDLGQLGKSEGRRYRAANLAVVFQNHTQNLTPTMAVGDQIAEAVQVVTRTTSAQARDRARAAMASVGIDGIARRFHQFPHELSGGLRQRVMIAMALVNGPALLIADEPTTALDVTIQAGILKLLRDAASPGERGILFISHDIGVIREIADRVLVMYAGKIVESIAASDLDHPLHPYTASLLAAVPTLDARRDEALVGISGAAPPLAAGRLGCPFEPRCPVRLPRCSADAPELLELAVGHLTACHVAALRRRALDG